jgi:4-hydroxythreonine-4-phosphate dehydrogenase
MGDKRPIIAVTMGDPAGVGPEICLKALNRSEQYDGSRPVVIGERSVIEQAMQFCRLNMHIKSISRPSHGSYSAGTIDFIDMKNIGVEEFSVGTIDPVCGKASFDYIEQAVRFALGHEVHAVATAPISKEALKQAQIDYPGHTEIFGGLTGVTDPLTMFEAKRLRIFFLTRHMSLLRAIQAVTEDRVFDYIVRCTNALRSLGVDNPLLAVAGLNPHCGDGGMFGDEEIHCIEPAVKRARMKGLRVEGPVPADSVFALTIRGRFSAVLSLYHDQGHIAAKTLDFENTVSITLGLPFLRTSPDHGTAFDIAGTGTAQEHSMVAALQAASRYARKYGI